MVRNEIVNSPDHVVFNFKSDRLQMNADDVPTLLPREVFDELKKGDPEPFFKLQAIEFPAIGNGIYPFNQATYTEEFFQSFVDVTKERPIPGSKRGHEFRSRPANDFYMVGGKLESKGNGKGRVIFKMYVPPDGDESSNLGLIRDMRANIVNFSLVSRPAYVVDGEEQRFVGSAGSERNDAVQLGEGAMEQTTNSTTIDTRAIEALIDAGNCKVDGQWSILDADKPMLLFGDGVVSYPYGKNGIVYRSALHHTMNRAAADGYGAVASAAKALIERIGNKTKRRNSMEREEMLEQLKNMVANGKITLRQIADAVGLGDQLVTDDQKAALAIVNSLKEAGVADAVKTINELRAQLESVNTDRVKNRLDAEFGPEKDKDGVENALRAYAGDKLSKVKASDLDAEIEKFKNDPVAKQLAGNRADTTSVANRVGIVDGSGKNSGDGGPTVIDKY